MDKIKLAGIANNNRENYFKIKIEDVKDQMYVKNIMKVFDDLHVDHGLDDAHEKKNYDFWIDTYWFVKSKDYVVHLIFSKEYLYIILTCDPKRREEFVNTLKKYCTWIV